MQLTYKFNYYDKNQTIDNWCLVSNNLYNQANYIIKEELKLNKKWLRYNDLNKILSVTPNLEGTINYKLLKAQSAQQILKLVDKDWSSYFRSIKDFGKNKSKYKGMPKPPGFKSKNGKNILVFTNQDSRVRCGKIKLSKTCFIDIPEYKGKDFTKFNQVRIIPKNNYYQIEIIYNQDVVNSDVDYNNYLSIDLGINNLATCVAKEKTFILSGKIIKSVNHYYNKMKSIYSSMKDSSKKKVTFNKRLNDLSFKRENIIKISYIRCHVL